MSWRTLFYSARRDFQALHTPPRRFFAAAIIASVSFIPSGGADTYSAWKARVFTETEQADPSISGETALSPAGDGIPNLLKYAFALDPHQNGSLALPQIGLSQIVDPITGRPATYPTITYRVSSSDAPSDLYFVPEISFDLQNWVRGDFVFGAPNSQAGGNPGDATLVTYQALSSVAGNAKAFLRLRILEGQTLPDDWQIRNFGQTGIDANGDADLDGRSNFDEFLHGTDPNDYYEGRTPTLEIVSGDNQRSSVASFLPAPLVVEVTFDGQPMVNAPVVFAIASGDAALARLNDNLDLAGSTVEVRTDFNGLASAFVYLGQTPDEIKTIRVRGGNSGIVTFSAGAFPITRPFVAAGSYHSFELDGNGRLWEWGANWSGQLGDGTTDERDVPVENSNVTAIRDIIGGYAHTVSVKWDGTVWTWGSNGSGQLGDGTTDDRSLPAMVSNMSNVIAVAAGSSHAIALKSDGSVWAWGYNGDGELGNGSTDDSLVPVQVRVQSGDPLTNIVAIASGSFHGLAVKSDGSVWAWGGNWSGQLGDGTTEDKHYAVAVVNLGNIKKVKAGSYHSLALSWDGTVTAWGGNFAGQLGNGNLNRASRQDASNGPLEDSSIPTLVAGLTDVMSLSVGDLHSLAVRVDGTVWAWGDNSSGQLGIDAISQSDHPVQVVGLSNIDSVAAGNSHSLARAGDGTVWSFGANFYGQLGRGSKTVEVTPAPTDKDADHNGLSDEWEKHYFGNPGHDPYMDSDRDGLTDVEEYQLGTDPNNPDTDGDHLPDGQDGWPNDALVNIPRLPEYSYAAIDLGSGIGRAINNRNEVIGSNPYSSSGGFYWDKGDRQDLFGLQPLDINDNGTVLFSDTNLHPSDPDDHLLDFDPNITWSHMFYYFATSFNNAGRVTMNYVTFGSIVSLPSYSAGTTSLSGGQPSFLRKIPDSNDAQLSLVDKYYHGFKNTWDDMPTEPCPDDPRELCAIFGTSYNNHWGLDDNTYAVTINNYDQVLGNCSNFEGLDQFGYPLRQNQYADPGSVSVVIWNNQQPELVTEGGAYTWGSDLNDDGVVAGKNDSGETVIWLKTDGQWKEDILKDLGGLDDPHLNNNLQIVSGNQLYQNGRTVDLDTRVPAGYRIRRSTAINDQGLIVGEANISTEDQTLFSRAVLLVPAALVPDYNRDDVIDDQDKGKVTKDNPYRFWINDDDDSGDTEGDGIPGYAGDGVGVGNGTDDAVNGTKDLVDFFPVFLDIKQLLRVLPPDKFEYILQNEDHHLNFVYTDLTAAKSGDYLKTATSFGAAQVNHIGSNGQTLAEGFLSSVADGERGVLLFEAGLEVTHPLELIVRDKANGQKTAQVSLPLSIKSVESMYRHYNVLFADNVTGGRRTKLGTPPNYPDELCNQKSFVCVHGYNVNPAQARGWNAKTFKSMWWTGSRAKFYGVTWNGAETQVLLGSRTVTTNYHRNVDNAFATAERFAGFINSLGPDVTVVAHSLGNVVVSSAIHDWGAHVKNYYMVDAAVAIEAYDGGASKEPLMVHEDWYEPNRAPDQNYTERLWASEWYQNSALPTDDARKTLTWRDRLSRITENTTVYNFYSSGEEVLAEPDVTTPTTIGFIGGQLFNAVYGDSPCGEKAWILQEKLKGRAVSGEILGSTYGGWGFNPQWYLDGGIRRPTPQEAGALRDDQLIQDPFFRPGPPDLHNANGSSYASAQAHGNTLLAEMIPARTRPVGGNELVKLTRDFGGDRNVDLTNLENGWPGERPTTRWLHSDVNAVAFRYTWKLFNEFKTLASLDQ
jgi:alpha-tubulin suppressor-like RCC1 family protein